MMNGNGQAPDFSLQLGGGVATGLELGEGFSAFAGLVDEVAQDILAWRPDPVHPEWITSMAEGGRWIGLKAVNISVRELGIVKGLIEGGIKLTEGEGLPPRELKVEAWRCLSDLSKLAKGGVDVHVWTGRKKNRITNRTAEVLAGRLRTAYRDYGSVEGDIEDCFDGAVPCVKLRDPMGGMVKCEVGRDLLEECRNLHSCRVEMYGRIHYREDGSIVKMQATEVERLPDRSEWVPVSDIVGIFANAD